MGRLKRYYTAIRRYNRSKGYGIHSPYAFRFVLRVLRERCPYYQYEEIKAVRKSAVRLGKSAVSKRVISYRNAKMLFRVTCHFNPRAILQIGTVYGVSTTTMLSVSRQSRLVALDNDTTTRDVYDKIIAPVASRVSIERDIADALTRYNEMRGDAPSFLFVNDITGLGDDLLPVCIDTINQGGVIVMRNLFHSKAIKKLWHDVGAAVNHGMGFTNERIGIFVGLKHLPRQNFALWF